jgi:hypothetical protein
MSAEITIGRVGELSPPPGLVADLRSFDSDLRLVWRSNDQCWSVVQRVRRTRGVGEWGGCDLNEVYEVDRPVLYLTEHEGEPDRRIIPALRRQRAMDRRQGLERAARRAREEKEAKSKRTKDALEPMKERMESAYYGLRSQGFAGSVRPSFVPGSSSAA